MAEKYRPNLKTMKKYSISACICLGTLIISCGPSDQEIKEAEKRAADSLAAAKEMMDAAKEAALMQSQIRQQEIVDSLAKNPDTTKLVVDTVKGK
jgi:hypothetical protein